MNYPFSTEKRGDVALDVDDSFWNHLSYAVLWGESGLHKDHIN